MDVAGTHAAIELPEGSWWDWDVVTWDGGELRLAADSDLTYHHGLELRFGEPLFVSCPSAFQDPIFRAPSFDEVLKVTRQLGCEPTVVVAFEAEAGGQETVSCSFATTSAHPKPLPKQPGTSSANSALRATEPPPTVPLLGTGVGSVVLALASGPGVLAAVRARSVRSFAGWRRRWAAACGTRLLCVSPQAASGARPLQSPRYRSKAPRDKR
nr:hypothetical protein OG409_37275 [Streptomyces sp. NBC_00974]